MNAHEDSAALYGLGLTLANSGHYAQAAAALTRFTEINPLAADAWNDLGCVLTTLSRPREAINAFKCAYRAKPDFVNAVLNAGNLLAEIGDPEAADLLVRALVLEPQDVDTLVRLVQLSLSVVCAFTGSTLDSQLVTVIEAMIAAHPEVAALHYHFGELLGRLGRTEEAIERLSQAVELAPENQRYHDHLILMSDMALSWDLQRMQRVRREWARRFADSLPTVGADIPDRRPDRPLRVGYVSACLFRHAGAHVFGPALLGYDPAATTCVCLNSSPKSDDVTAMFKAHASEWHDVGALSDEELARKIVDLRIDILVDLDGFSNGNRLLTFARRPAPIQVHAWGHATGTGMAAMDYFFADEHAIPQADRLLFAETIVDLPCYIGYAALSDPRPVGPLPARSNGFVTFGSLNRLTKFNPQVYAAWAEVLHRIGNARLLIKAAELDSETACKSLREVFAALGIPAERLILIGRSSQAEHRAAYNRIDIALDSWPLGGGTTTAEALWMGVPTVSLAWPTTSGRNGLGLLTAVGLPDFVAGTREEFVRIAAEKAADLDGLARLRAGLRERLEKSPVGDVGIYAGAVEKAYRAMWHRWLAETATCPGLPSSGSPAGPGG